MAEQELPPNHSIDAEQGLLGAILINNEAMRLVSGIVSHEHFFEPIHQHVFDVCSSLLSMGKSATPVTISPFLPQSQEIGGGMNVKQYVARLASEATTIINAADYAQIIRDYADMRSLQDTAQRMIFARSPDPDKYAADAIDVMDSVMSARTLNVSAKAVNMQTAVTSAVDAAANAYKFDGVVNGVKTGFADLDWKLGAMQGGDLIVAAGRPGMGKTGWALGAALNMAMKQESIDDVSQYTQPGVIFSLEMDEVQLTQRMLSDLIFWDGGKVPYNLMRTGRFGEQQFEAIRRAALKLAKLPIHIETKARISLAELSARARRWKRQGQLKWLIIDYLQLMKGSRHYEGQRVQEISDITMGLKALAKELGIPVILLSQLSRDVEKREDKRPHLADLRDSGSIEQDADVVLMLYREEYYLQNREPRPGTEEHVKWEVDMERAHGKVEIGIGKNRSGPTGTLQLWADMGCNAFRSLVEDEALPQQEKML